MYLVDGPVREGRLSPLPVPPPVPPGPGVVEPVVAVAREVVHHAEAVRDLQCWKSVFISSLFLLGN